MAGKFIKHSKDLAGGPEGTRFVLSHMKRLALRDSKDKTIAGITRQISQNCQNKKGQAREYCELHSAYKYISDNVRYVYDPVGREHVTAPKFLLTTNKYGDCDCMSTAFAAIVTALGYSNQFKVIKAERGNNEYSHVYNVVFVPSIKSWIPIDTIFEQVKGKNGFGNEKTGTPDERYYEVYNAS